MTIPLQQGIIYGPVNSRRLGRSLGVNIVSSKIKTCTFNCVYCQYGLRRISEDNLSNPKLFPSSKRISESLIKIIKMLPTPPDYITFSGNGESSLHPSFPEIVEQVKQIRDMYAPESKTAILSNSSTANKKKIRDALSNLDNKIMKLDCGNEETFIRYNQPVQGIFYNEILVGLKKMDKITIQALFSGGSGGNYTSEHIRDWIEKIVEINPSNVQIYSLDRPYPSEYIFPLKKEDLLVMKELLVKNNINAEVY